MRYREFALVENPVDEPEDLSAYIEDDLDPTTMSALMDVLHRVQANAKDATIPKISREALIRLVQNMPGGESFDKNALDQAKDKDDTVKNIIKSIDEDDNGVMYVYINPVEPMDDPDAGMPAGATPTQTAPEKTVSAMANRALGSRS